MSYGLHGQKRTNLSALEKEKLRKRELKAIEQYQSKLEEYNSLSIEDENYLNLNELLLLENPDYYTLWNERRKVLSVGYDVNKELKFIQKCLKIRPKTYWIWNHRIYILNLENQMDLWESELNLINHLLDLDARNFHGWNYRSFIVNNLIKFKVENKLLEEELKYTEMKLKQSFSNGSAWHYRTYLLNKLNNINQKDFKLVKTAFYTDPDDQSAFFFYLWLIQSQALFKILNIPKVYLINNNNITYLTVYFDSKVQLNGTPNLKDSNNEVICSNWISTIKSEDGYCKVWKSEIKLTNKQVDLNLEINNQYIDTILYKNFDKVSYSLNIKEIEKNRFIKLDINQVIYSEFEQEFKKELNQHIQMVEKEMNEIKELIDLEPEARWPINTLLFLNQIHLKISSIANLEQKDLIDSKSLLKTLIEIDPLRKGFYNSKMK